jgi:mannosyltransferase OCH1-like enzyme
MFRINNINTKFSSVKKLELFDQKRSIINTLQSKKIPKNIFQVYPDINIPECLNQHMNNFKNKNPHWKYTLFNDETIIDYIKQNYPEYLEVYIKINPEYGAARADFFRYLLMYKEGGVYLDCKSIIYEKLDNLIKYDDEFLIFYQHDNIWHKKLNGLEEYWQWIIICIPKHPFLKAVIHQVVYNINNYNVIDDESVGKIGVLDTTGPFVYTREIAKLTNKYSHRFINSINVCERVHLYDYYEIDWKNYKKHYTKLKSKIVI